MLKVSIGPIRQYPSWEWLGEDTSRELKKYFNITNFKSFSNIPASDVVLVIKQIPPIHITQKFNVIYLPVDVFTNENQVKTSMPILRRCKLILSHSRRLIPLLPRHTQEIDHHLKFKTLKIADYKEKGYILWSGSYQYSPFIFKFLETHKINNKVKLLTNYTHPPDIHIAKAYADKLKTRLIQKSTGNIELELWTEKRQNEVLSEAKVAIDIKGDSFNQQHKPPTKTQKYICAGLPVALNKESESYDYACSQELNTPTPDNIEYWFSKEYYEENKKVAEKLKNDLSLESIGIKLKEHIERVIQQ